MDERTFNNELSEQPDIELETITNLPGIKIPDCCRENWDECEHRLRKPEKKDYNPV
mgnify:CR=1 FL=1